MQISTTEAEGANQPTQAQAQMQVPFAMRMIRLAFAILCRLAPNLAVRWADNLFFDPMAKPRPASELPWYSSANRTTLDYNGEQIAVYEWGNGPKTILVVHGWGSRATRLGHLSGPLNELGYRVVGFDAPGHGDSSGKVTNLVEISEIITTLYNKYGPIQAMVGHSMGGMAISIAVARNNLKVGRLAIVASPLSLKYVFSSFAGQINLTSKVLEMLRLRIEQRFRRLYNLEMDGLSPEFLIPKINIPAIIFHDKGDWEVEVGEAEGYANGLPNSQLVVTSGLGHRRILRDPNIVSQLVAFVTHD